MNRPDTPQVSRTGRRSPRRGLRALLWRWRWILLLALLLIAPPLSIILQLYLARFGLAWITLVAGCILLVALLIIGVRRENRRSHPVPPPPRPPGHEIDESVQAPAPAPLDQQARLAA